MWNIFESRFYTCMKNHVFHLESVLRGLGNISDFSHLNFTYSHTAGTTHVQTLPSTCQEDKEIRFTGHLHVTINNILFTRMKCTVCEESK